MAILRILVGMVRPKHNVLTNEGLVAIRLGADDVGHVIQEQQEVCLFL